MNTPASKPSTTTASTAPTPPPPVVATISDTFDTDYIDGTKWYEICCSGTGATLAENAGDLEYAFAPDTTPGGQFSTAGGHVGTRCRFPGDFDARVDFALVDWPSGNGVVVSLYAFLGAANTALQVNRSSSAVWGEQYGGWFDQEAPGSAQLPDKTGTLRLLRKDGLVTGYFLHNGNWQTLSTHRIDLPATIALGANVGPGYGTSFGGQQVVVDLDNFTVTGANPACPSGSQPSSG